MTAGHISCAATEGVVRPVLHELLPFGEEVTTPIRCLHLVAHRMGQRHFCDLLYMVFMVVNDEKASLFISLWSFL